jgi:hypothetical protein
MSIINENIMVIQTGQEARLSEGEPAVPFEEWSALKAKKDLPCKVINELRCKPFKDDDFCISCYREEVEHSA